ncbi:MAG: hypothetical protein MR319_08520 [Mediterranea sp.]|nr:hypothetical protein [Mediterranea sp.]
MANKRLQGGELAAEAVFLVQTVFFNEMPHFSSTLFRSSQMLFVILA